MRWLLSWKFDQEKYKELGGRKAKARAIILGYQDPKYQLRETSAPTPSKAGRQLFFQLAACRRFRISKGDISGAFLQGDDLVEPLWCRPLPEICRELNVPENTPMLLRKAAYGLVQAPLHWYRSVCNYLQSIGYTRLQSEPCCWIYKDAQGVVRSVIHGHVDDFMFAGGENCPAHQSLMEKLKQRFSWGTWEEGRFVQCGIQVSQNEDYSIDLDQEHSIRELEEIHLTRDRARQTELPTTDREKSEMRAVLGSLSWITGQTCFMYAVDTNFLITTVPVSTVKDILEVNKVVRAVQKWSRHRLRIHSFRPGDVLEFTRWTDAAWANRPNGKDSTEGVFIGMSNGDLR